MTTMRDRRLWGVLALHLALSAVGITWGLPSRDVDEFIFAGDHPAWPGWRIYQSAGAAGKFIPTRGADVDPDPLAPVADTPVPLTATETDVARILIRYRLFTHQPDEMITMMALAGMKPGAGDFDPRLYQYGGLFIYPVGALIRTCGWLGLIDVRADVAHYLDNPDEFARFYVVSRAYAAAWGLLAAAAVFAIARRLGGRNAALFATTLFVLLPVTVCLAHEGKPHLPGAALMLLAVAFAMKHRESAAVGRQSASTRHYWLMCIACGAALGMVISSWPIFVLIPLIALWPDVPHDAAAPRARMRSWLARFFPLATGTALGIGVYLVTNPYIVINAFTNRAVLQSNLGNSLNMYEMGNEFHHVLEGLRRVLELTTEGATGPVLLLGFIAAAIAGYQRNRAAVPLLVPAVVFFTQFVLIGAGKPAEYGRFGIFTGAALAIGTACVVLGNPSQVGVAVPRGRGRVIAACCLIFWTAAAGGAYLRNFVIDTTDGASRVRAARAVAGLLAERSDFLEGTSGRIILAAEPAPYSCPPLPFATTEVVMHRTDPGKSPVALEPAALTFRDIAIRTVDTPAHQSDQGPLERVLNLWRITPISWANKPIEVTTSLGRTYY